MALVESNGCQEKWPCTNERNQPCELTYDRILITAVGRALMMINYYMGLTEVRRRVAKSKNADIQWNFSLISRCFEKIFAPF